MDTPDKAAEIKAAAAEHSAAVIFCRSAIAPSAVDYWICKCYYRNISLHTEA